MIKDSLSLRTTKFIVKDIFLDILTWPFWWYTTGVLTALKKMRATIAQGNEELALSIWIKNIFKPMFGQYDWQGRIISFFMRLFQIIFRSIIFFFWFLISLIVFLFWLVLPPIILFGILFNLGLFQSLI
jgi:hypothetical protein